MAREPLSRPAGRLLASLGAPGVAALPDPTRDGFHILSGTQSGLSLGRGACQDTLVDELLAHDLVERDARRHVVISETGRARLRRDAAAHGPDVYAAQHRDLVTEERESPHDRERVTLNAGESPLDWLRRRRDRGGEPLIDAAAFEAGERLRRDLTFAAMLPSVTARWDGAIGGGAGALRDPAGATDVVVAARQRTRAALSALEPEFAGLLIDLCGFLKGLEAIERERRWPPRSAKVVVRLALGQLARHYGLASEACGPGRAAALRTWIAEEADAA